MNAKRAAIRRWVTYGILTVLFALACFSLSVWQFSRRDEALNNINLVIANYDAPAVPLDQLVPSTHDSIAENIEWRQVTVTGSYDPENQLLVRNRPRESQPGFELLTPLITAEGKTFIVDRGWLPTGARQDSPDAIPDPPAGPVTVTVHLKPGEPTIAGRGTVAGQVATINLDEIEQVTGDATYTNTYGLLVSENPPVHMGDLLSAKKPDTSEGMHLSYALQWILFALLAFTALIWAIRKEILARREPANATRLGRLAQVGGHTRSRVKPKRVTDEEVEDLLNSETISPRR